MNSENIQNERFKSLGLRIFKDNSYENNTIYVLIIHILRIICIILLMTLYLYCAIVSKYLPDTDYYILNLIKYDYYYCYMIPLSIIPTYFVYYLNWLCISLLESN